MKTAFFLALGGLALTGNTFADEQRTYELKSYTPRYSGNAKGELSLSVGGKRLSTEQDYSYDVVSDQSFAASGVFQSEADLEKEIQRTACGKHTVTGTVTVYDGKTHGGVPLNGSTTVENANLIVVNYVVTDKEFGEKTWNDDRFIRCQSPGGPKR